MIYTSIFRSLAGGGEEKAVAAEERGGQAFFFPTPPSLAPMQYALRSPPSPHYLLGERESRPIYKWGRLVETEILPRLST